ncbi:MAG: glutathionylspermidine synthase family protein [Formosimonas sp.]
MRRVLQTPRADWPQRMERIGFHFHSMDGLYWREDYAYEFSERQIDELDDASSAMHALCTSVLSDLVRTGNGADFGWSEAVWRDIERSYRAGELSLYGRFDWVYDGVAPPKLLEYNADTPTSLIESSLAQWHWQQDVQPAMDQFNSLHEKIVARWRHLRERWQAQGGSKLIYFVGLYDNQEEAATLDYLNEMAVQAGWQSYWLDMEDIGFHTPTQRFHDLAERPMDCVFKLYPWEWMMREPFGAHAAHSQTRWIEPMWKMIWANKAFMAHLWQAAPHHPNLLPTYFSPEPFGTQPYVKKPFSSREGTGISLHHSAYDIALPLGEDNQGFVYQAFAELPKFGDAWTVVGTWMVGDESAGLAIREDATPITRDTSHFVPHYFIPNT